MYNSAVGASEKSLYGNVSEIYSKAIVSRNKLETTTHRPCSHGLCPSSLHRFGRIATVLESKAVDVMVLMDLLCSKAGWAALQVLPTCLYLQKPLLTEDWSPARLGESDFNGRPYLFRITIF